MDEKDTVSQSLVSEPAEVSIWAKRAIWCVAFGCLAPLVWWIIMMVLSFLPYQSNSFNDSMYVLVMLSIIIGIPAISITMLIGLIFGILALRDIWIEEGQLRGKWRAVTAIVLSSIFLLYMAVGIILGQTVGKRDHISWEHEQTCKAHLSELSKALHRYAGEHGAYPAPDKWCDALLQGKYVTEDTFKCPGNKKARCSYSMNPKCLPNSSPNIILIFESRSGWNSYGGPELFTTENHDGDGQILLNDGSITYLMKDPNGLPYDNNGGDRKYIWYEKK
ncbi:MAG: DUF4190 domain-containing protein [Sedimentisphaerales bacterium]|jgi:hypothetical protein